MDHERPPQGHSSPADPGGAVMILKKRFTGNSKKIPGGSHDETTPILPRMLWKSAGCTMMVFVEIAPWVQHPDLGNWKMG